MMKRGLLLVGALVAAIGCDKAAPKPIADDLPAGEVRLLAAGAEPRAVLRYQVAKGSHSKLAMTMRIALAAGGMPVPQPPRVHMAMDEECVDVEPSGAMRFEVTIGSVTTEGSGQMADALNMASDMMKNLVYRFRMSPSGQVDAVVVDGLTGPMAELGTQLKDSIEQFAAPLPAEPVGKGATWKFKRSSKTSGVDVATVSQFELVDLADHVATFKVRGRVVAPHQTIDRMGISLELVKMDGKVSGIVTNDLHRFAPTGTFGVTMDMTVSMRGKELSMKTTVDSEMTAP